MITIPRKIVYKEKRTMHYFLNKSKACSLNCIIYDKILVRDKLFKDTELDKDVIAIFNDAYYITTLVFYEHYPKLRMLEYFRIASKNNRQTRRGYIVMSIVFCYLKHILYENEEQIRFASSFIEGMNFHLDHRYKETSNRYYDIISSYKKEETLLIDEFKPRELQQSDIAINWPKITNDFNLEKIDKVVKLLGTSQKEKFYIVDYMYYMFKLSAENGYYSKTKTKDSIESTFKHLKELILYWSNDLDKVIIQDAYSYEDVFNPKEKATNKNVANKEVVDALIAENQLLKKQIETLKLKESIHESMKEPDNYISRIESEKEELQKRCDELQINKEQESNAIRSLVEHLIAYAEGEERNIAKEIKFALGYKMSNGCYPIDILSEDWKNRYDTLGCEKKAPIQNIYNLNSPIGTMVAHADEIKIKSE